MFSLEQKKITHKLTTKDLTRLTLSKRVLITDLKLIYLKLAAMPVFRNGVKIQRRKFVK